MRRPQVIYEDNHLLVVIKPPNVPSQADDSQDEDMLSICKAYLKEKYAKPGEVYLGLVHRLDRPAGGLMVFARTSKAAARLGQQMQQGEFQKKYLAVTEGIPEGSGTYSDYLQKGSDRMTRVVSAETKGAKQALLHYRILEAGHGRALVEVDLITGRPHQIRVQFASRGTPLYGDARYGNGGAQLALYACELSFLHPTKRERMRFCSDACEQRFRMLLK